ncbi:MAG: hypothetical protein PHC85_00015 [Candidatus Pacebacteria bacterium]|nr:hypothetical protein [Candidatus Paceibacterota bacterium]
MAIFEWRTRKKITLFLIASAVIAVFGFLIFYFIKNEPTCSDGRQNQDEEKIDCGGGCNPCVENPKDLTILWTRALETGQPGIYEAASLVENTNLFYGLYRLKYAFRLYDDNNILVAVKEGETYVNPGEKFVIFSADIEVGNRKPVRAFMETEYISEWKYAGAEKNSLVVSSKNFSGIPFPSLSVKLFNESVFSVKDVDAAAVLYDERGNVMAVSYTKVDSIPGEEYRNAVFTWPALFAKDPSSSEIFTRVNFSKK